MQVRALLYDRRTAGQALEPLAAFRVAPTFRRRAAGALTAAGLAAAVAGLALTLASLLTLTPAGATGAAFGEDAFRPVPELLGVPQPPLGTALLVGGALTCGAGAAAGRTPRRTGAEGRTPRRTGPRLHRDT